MPLLVPIGLIGFGLLAVGGSLKLAGDAIDDAGSGALKLVGAAALGAGVWLAIKRFG